MNRSEHPRNSAPLWSLLALSILTITAAALRFHSLGAKTFWFDEGVSVGIARLDWVNFARILWRREANMSLYYLLLHPWLRWGNSESFVRSLSVLFAVATIPAMYALGRRLFDSRTGLIAAALLTVNAYHVRYSQEARGYSLMVLLCVLSSVYFLKCLDEPSSRNRDIYAVVSGLAVYAHFYSLLLIAAQWLSLRFLDREAIPAALNAAWKRIALAVSPILLFVVTTGAGPLRWIQRPSLGDLWRFAILLSGNGGIALLLAYLVAIGCAIFPALRNRLNRRFPRESWRYKFLLIWLLFPIILALILSLARPLFLPRYFIFCLPALLLLAATGLSRIRPAWLLAPALLLFAALSLKGTMAYYQQDFDDERDDWRSVSGYVLGNTQPGDVLLFHVPMGRMPYEYYHSLAGTSWGPRVLYPSHGDRITFLDFVEKPDYLRLGQALTEYPRVWIVISHAETPSGLDQVATKLTNLANGEHPHVEEREFAGVEVRLYWK